MVTILQSPLPFAPWMDLGTARLPGMLPLNSSDRLIMDDIFAGLMA
ncbi:MAG: hypothetical protein QMB16_07405 [Paracoccaceae bacterium]